MKQRRSKTVYVMQGKNGGGFKFQIVPKNKRYHGVDGIRMKWRSSKEAEKDKKFCWVYDMKDWEALVIIEGLIATLLSKKGIGKRS